MKNPSPQIRILKVFWSCFVFISEVSAQLSLHKILQTVFNIIYLEVNKGRNTLTLYVETLHVSLCHSVRVGNAGKID